MSEFEIVRGVLRRSTRSLTAAHPLAKELLAFGRDNGGWLFGLKAGQAGKLTWTAFKQALRGEDACPDAAHPIFRLASDLGRLLDLDETDRRVLDAMFAFARMPRANKLSDILCQAGHSLPITLGETAGLAWHEAERRVRLHPLVRFGLIRFKADFRGRLELSIRWTLERLIDRLPETEGGIVHLMVGGQHEAHLSLSAFTHIDDADFLQRLLEGAARERAEGVNILIHGPPGTGKTEFARTLAAAAGHRLYGVGEALDDGEEPDRWDRICAYQMGQRLLSKSANAALLFDEMEDLIGDAQPASGDWVRGREGSKVFINRLLETNLVPVIWTTNTIGNVDPAILRRMSFVLRLDLPSRKTALRMLDHVAGEEGTFPDNQWGALIDAAPETAAVLRVAARGARLAGEADGGVRPARSLAAALRGKDVMSDHKDPVDLALYETDRPLDVLFGNVQASGAADISLLLTGPPGTGKTALAWHFAQMLDRPLLVKRTSDLLSKWVGQTEGNIADAFAQARANGSVLLFDEVDSLLFDRSSARANWEVSQVNELLTWLDTHPYPVIAATNFAKRLDPATARRFVFKLELRALSGVKAAKAFMQFFGMEAPASLNRVQQLTPGDFAVVARQLRHDPAANAGEIVTRLAAEAAAKPGSSQPIGF